MGIFAKWFKRTPKRASLLSDEELDRLSRESVDPLSWGTSAETQEISYRENAHRSDDELVALIKARNEKFLPTFKLRLEYRRRLMEREQ